MKPMIFHSNGTDFIDIPNANQKHFDGQIVQLLDDGGRTLGNPLADSECLWAMFPDGTPRIVWSDELTDPQDGTFRQKVVLAHLRLASYASQSKERMELSSGDALLVSFYEGQWQAYRTAAGMMGDILHPAESPS